MLGKGGFGIYRILFIIGEVWRVNDLKENKPYAMKIISLKDMDEAGLESAKKEAEVYILLYKRCYND